MTSLEYEKAEMSRTHQEFDEYSQAEESISELEARLFNLILKRRKANVSRLLAMERNKAPRNILVIKVPPLVNSSSHVRYVRSIPIAINSGLGMEKSLARIENKNRQRFLHMAEDMLCTSMLQIRFGTNLCPHRTTHLKRTTTCLTRKMASTRRARTPA